MNTATPAARLNKPDTARKTPDRDAEPAPAANGAACAPAAAPAAVSGQDGTNQPPTTPTSRRDAGTPSAPPTNAATP
ncbi:MAG: hypothetical protein NTW21_06235 [Verrucomicrobia bacterium]|nr:hypothetical protein [Verrucomicrobiota bacterium]